MSLWAMGTHVGLYLKNERKTKFNQLRVNNREKKYLELESFYMSLYIVNMSTCLMKLRFIIIIPLMPWVRWIGLLSMILLNIYFLPQDI